jgi:serine/threonine-protein kinase
VLREAAAALTAAHRAGVVHRDIKPDNILFDGPADDRRAVLTDFGIAKAMGGETPGLTQTGAVIGTPHYMSPEQASGERTIDHRSDLYSLGVVGYQMLTGRVPFDGPTVAAVLMQQIAHEAAPLTRVRPDCPPELARAIMRCLAKTPEERWASAEDLARALATEGDEPATRAVRRSSGVRAARLPDPVRHFRVVTGACVAGAIALVLIDVVMHRVLLGPLGVLIGAFIVSAQYGRLWIAGFTWRQVLTPHPVASAVASPLPLDSAELGPHRGSIQQARNDRAAMLARIQGLSSAERKRLGDVLPAVDAVIARATEDARQLYTLERQLEPGPDEIGRRLTDTRAESASPGRAQRIAILERRLVALQDIAARRERLVADLTKRLAAAAELRFSLDQAVSAGLAEGLQAIGAAVGNARALAQETGAGQPI